MNSYRYNHASAQLSFIDRFVDSVTVQPFYAGLKQIKQTRQDTPAFLLRTVDAPDYSQNLDAA